MARLVVGNGWTCACDREKCSTECEYYLDFMSVKTNGDKIRAMTDEELADWYFNEFFRKVPYCRKEECYEDTPCEECLLDWLKQEVE